MKGVKSLISIFLIFRLAEAVYNCDSTIGICSINDQSISASDPFVINRDNASSVTLLIITESSMPQVPQNIFKNYPELNLLSISNTSLQEISSNVFTNALKLTTLFLMQGYLTTINNGTFSSCVKLQSLHVTNQQISSIDIMAFQGLKALQNLYLSNNQLSSLNPMILSVLPKLMYFSIENNQFSTLDSKQFVNNPSLNVVLLTGNMITTLPNDLFQAQSSIYSFYAARNKMVTAQSYGASYVDVSNNKLRNFTVTSGESTVHIENNFIRKIICGSTNLTVQRLYVDNNLLTNFLCIRDMVNLTDLSVNNNKMPKPNKKAFLNLSKLRTFEMFNMTRFSSVPAKMLTPMTSLSILRVERLAAYRNLNVTLPKLGILSLTTNTWNCTYLTSINNILKSQRIILLFNVGSDRARCQL